MQHLIKKQLIELFIDPALDAFRVQQQMSEHYWNQLLRLLEKAFDEASTQDEVVVIDRLEIDLGVITEKEISQATWDKEILAKITQQIKEHTIEVNVVGKLEKTDYSVPIGLFKQWLFYMKKGFLPWNFWQTDENWSEKVIEILENDNQSIAVLRTEIQQSDTVLTRIIRQHTQAFVIKLIEILTAESQVNLPTTITEIQGVFDFVQARNKLVSKTKQLSVEQLSTELLWKQALFLSAEIQQPQTTVQLAAKLLEKYVPNEALMHENITQLHIKLLMPVIQELQMKASKNISNKIKQKQEARQTKKGIKTEGKEAEKGIKINKKTQVEKEKVSDEVNGETRTNKETPLTQNDAENSFEAIKNNIAEEDGIFVQQAGLVLVHPFLNSFFKHMGVLEGKQFKDSVAQEKALYLLHYLATKNTFAEEHELVIPKILCGYALETPVSKEVGLLKKEKREATEMLKAVIAQWEILKNTSPDGLREGFLTRVGKVSVQQGKIMIRVETTAIDVLLEHLPWNLGIIKFPWLNEFIHVTWQ